MRLRETYACKLLSNKNNYLPVRGRLGQGSSPQPQKVRCNLSQISEEILPQEELISKQILVPARQAKSKKLELPTSWFQPCESAAHAKLICLILDLPPI